MESYLSQHHEADKMIPEVEQFLKLAREVLSSFPPVLLQNRPNGEPTLYWVCLDLATRLMKVDHQVRSLCSCLLTEGVVRVTALCGMWFRLCRCRKCVTLHVISSWTRCVANQSKFWQG